MRAATILSPAFSKRQRISPIAFFLTASGFTIDSVRSFITFLFLAVAVMYRWPGKGSTRLDSPVPIPGNTEQHEPSKNNEPGRQTSSDGDQTREPYSSPPQDQIAD